MAVPLAKPGEPVVASYELGHWRHLRRPESSVTVGLLELEVHGDCATGSGADLPDDCGLRVRLPRPGAGQSVERQLTG
jgi:hypothetical protein